MKFRLLPVIAGFVVVCYACGTALASAPEKDNKPTKAKPVPSQTASAVTLTAGAKTTKGEVAPKKEPTPIPVQAIQEVTPQPQQTIDSFIQPLSSPSAGEQIRWQVISGGGSQGASSNYKLGTTIGQTASGLGTSSNYKLNAGFWQNFSSGCCVKEGDNNHNGSVNIVDVTFLVARLFQGGPAPSCPEEADVTDNGSINVVDLTTLVAFLFSGGSVGVCP